VRVGCVRKEQGWPHISAACLLLQSLRTSLCDTQTVDHRTGIRVTTLDRPRRVLPCGVDTAPTVEVEIPNSTAVLRRLRLDHVSNVAQKTISGC
jgi:hypothetical protein